jgi:hypothetical protein
MDGSDLAKDKRNPTVRLNTVLKGDHARVLQNLLDRKVVINYAEGIRFILTKYIETIDRPVVLVEVIGKKLEEDRS